MQSSTWSERKRCWLPAKGRKKLAPIFELRIRKAALRNGARVIRVGDVDSAVAELGNGVERVALVWDGVDLALGKRLVERLDGIPNLTTYIVSEQPNARGAETMGMLPREGGRDAFGMFADGREGTIASLAFFGANPARNAPNASAAREALGRIPFVVVSELFMTETAELATLVLPAKGAFEKSGTTLNLAGDLLPLPASLVAPEGALADLEMLIGLSLALGIDLPALEEVETAVAELAARRESFTFGDARYGASLDLQSAAPHRLFSGGGTSAHDERVAALREVNA